MKASGCCGNELKRPVLEEEQKDGKTYRPVRYLKTSAGNKSHPYRPLATATMVSLLYYYNRHLFASNRYETIRSNLMIKIRGTQCVLENEKYSVRNLLF